MRSSRPARLLRVLVYFLEIGVLHWDLAKLPGEIRWALAFVSRAALASVHAGKVTNNYSEVGGCQGVRGMAVLADQRGGVALLTAVLAVALGARHFADAGREDNLDAAGVVHQLNRC